MSSRFFAAHILGPDTHANRPDPSTAPYGSLFMCTTHNKLEYNDDGTWVDYASLAGGAVLPAGGSTGQVLAKDSGTDYDASWVTPPTEVLMIALGDETTAITTGTAVVTFRMPFAMTLTEVRASLTAASSSGAPAFDINEAGSTVLSTVITIDQGEKTSTTAATAPVISDSALADDAEITIDIDAAGADATGAKVYLIGTRS